MFDQEIMDNFLHDVELITTCLMDKDPDATLKGTIQIVGNKQFYFRKLRAWYFFIRHNAPLNLYGPQDSTTSLYSRPVPPNISRAEPTVTSRFPSPASRIRSRSAMEATPPA